MAGVDIFRLLLFALRGHFGWIGCAEHTPKVLSLKVLFRELRLFAIDLFARHWCFQMKGAYEFCFTRFQAGTKDRLGLLKDIVENKIATFCGAQLLY